MDLNNIRIGVVGLGYVGLPLAVAFGRVFPTTGLDISRTRIRELREGRDSTLEVTSAELAEAEGLSFSDDAADLAECTVYVVTVPTPIDAYKQPDLRPLVAASQTVGEYLKPGDVVVFESTVYPGATEEVCVPIMERESRLRLNQDFFVGYSPERINPGDKAHRVSDIVKVTSGCTAEAAEFVDTLYRRIITAGTHKASSIRVAEAAKVIENTQRDVNIALINELALLFDRLGLDTLEVLEAAGTKWNFLPFRPGFVGGHCIGVDPYYLTHKAQAVGHHPALILAGRRVNDGMGAFVAGQVIKLMTRRGMTVAQSRILVLGFAFKENCPDLRNTRVIDMVRELEGYGAGVEVHDPWVNPGEAHAEYGIRPIPQPEPGRYDAIVLAVAHQCFRELGTEGIRALGRPEAVLFDVKSLLPKESVDGRL